MFRLVSVVFIFISTCSLAQMMDNPSFEGPRGTSLPPPGWNPCTMFSTPDTQPGGWNVSAAPSNGNSYISLVTRGINGDEKNDTKEDIFSPLTSTMKAGVTYTISVDLAFSRDFDDLWYPPDWRPILLKVFLGTTYCDFNNEVWVSPKIDHTDWRRYGFHYTPQEPLSFIMLQVDYARQEPYNGAMLIDNLYIAEGELPIPQNNELQGFTEKCRVVIPNIFTPNDDHFNDSFVVLKTMDIQRFQLSVYNRWGKRVFESSDVNEGWDGKASHDGAVASGVYFYTMKCLCVDLSGVIQEDLASGTVTLVR